MSIKKEQNKMAQEITVTEKNLPSMIPEGNWGNANDFDSEDLLIPKLHLLQGLSKLVGDGSAHIGDIVNTVSKEKVADGKNPVEVFALTTNKTWIESFKEGNKFISQFPYTAANKHFPWEDVDAMGNKIKRDKVLNLYVMVASHVGDPAAIPFVVSFKGKSFKAAKLISNHFNNMQSMKMPPFAKTLKLFSKVEKNDKGTFQVWDMVLGRLSTKEEMAVCKTWYDRIKNNAASIKVDTGDVGDTDEDESSDRIPF